MTEEEYFIKNFPDFCYGDKPLSPHWDLFQFGVEFGERESEEKIEELEQKLEQTEKDLTDYQFNYPTIKELQKENAELEAIVRNTKAVDESFALKTIQLTKAKEIINEFLSYYHSNNYPYQMLEILGKAERFISEVDK